MAVFDYNSFPTLTTERLVLRELKPADAEDVFVFRSDPEGQKHNSEPMKQVSESLGLIDGLRVGYAARRQLYWAVTLKDQNKALGLFGFNYWERGHHRAEIGYDLARAYWGQGIATEALKAILQFGFERMELHRIETVTIADNFASVRLLERFGFRREGTRREYSLEHDGIYHDSAVYGLLQSEYAESSRRRDGHENRRYRPRQ